MKVHEKIRMIRELNHWTQEDMADKIYMSLNSYAKLERGESKLYLERLEKIAQLFEINLIDLLSSDKQGLFYLFHNDNKAQENTNKHLHSHTAKQDATLELEKLKLTLEYKDELLVQKSKIIEYLENQIILLNQLIEKK